jgi:hypothetical protein
MSTTMTRSDHTLFYTSPSLFVDMDMLIIPMETGQCMQIKPTTISALSHSPQRPPFGSPWYECYRVWQPMEQQESTPLIPMCRRRFSTHPRGPSVVQTSPLGSTEAIRFKTRRCSSTLVDPLFPSAPILPFKTRAMFRDIICDIIILAAVALVTRLCPIDG